MARNGTGTYVLPAGQPVVTNTVISSTVFNLFASDIANALTTSICTDGQTPMTAALSMGNYKINNLATGVLSGDATNKGQMDTAIAAALAGTVRGRNVIINGDFMNAQRATTSALTNAVAYNCLDNWFAYQVTSAAGICNQQAVTGGTRNFVAKLGRTAGSSLTNSINFGTVLDSATSIPLAGQTVILSIYAQAGANFSAAGSQMVVTLHTGKGTDQSATDMVNLVWTSSARPINTLQVITTSLVRYTFSVAIPSDTTQIGLQFGYSPVGTAGADDNLYIADVQLEPALYGATAASVFERLSPSESLIRCQRVCTKLLVNVVGDASAGSQAVGGYVPFPTTMRSTPTYSQLANNVSYTQTNMSTTTSSTSGNESGLLFFRTSSASGAAQFSERVLLTCYL